MPSAADYAKDRPAVSSTLLHIVENQVSTNEPPESRQALERLTAQGFTENDARTLLAHVVRVGMLYVLKEGKSFNGERFLKHLQALPELPAEP